MSKTEHLGYFVRFMTATTGPETIRPSGEGWSADGMHTSLDVAEEIARLLVAGTEGPCWATINRQDVQILDDDSTHTTAYVVITHARLESGQEVRYA